MASRFMLQQAARCYRQGGILAYPTESVYGLGCDPWNPEAVERLLALKNRPVEKGLILLTDHIDKLEAFVQLSPQQADKLANSENITWLVNSSPLTPPWIRGQYPKVAVRISRHPLASALCAQIPYPIVSTSANPARRAPARTVLQCRQYFNQQVDFIVPGNVGELSKPTRIIDMDTDKVYRP